MQQLTPTARGVIMATRPGWDFSPVSSTAPEPPDPAPHRPAELTEHRAACGMIILINFPQETGYELMGLMFW